MWYFLKSHSIDCIFSFPKRSYYSFQARIYCSNYKIFWQFLLKIQVSSYNNQILLHLKGYIYQEFQIPLKLCMLITFLDLTYFKHQETTRKRDLFLFYKFHTIMQNMTHQFSLTYFFFFLICQIPREGRFFTNPTFVLMVQITLIQFLWI